MFKWLFNKKPEENSFKERFKIYENAPLYKVGTPIINTGIKFYPVFQKRLDFNSYIGIRDCAWRYDKPVEYFEKLEDAIAWVEHSNNQGFKYERIT